MQKADRVLWEMELAGHLSRHPDLQNLPPLARPLRVRAGNLLLDLLLVLMIVLTMMAAGVAGWSIGLHFI